MLDSSIHSEDISVAWGCIQVYMYICIYAYKICLFLDHRLHIRRRSYHDWVCLGVPRNWFLQQSTIDEIDNMWFHLPLERFASDLSMDRNPNINIPFHVTEILHTTQRTILKCHHIPTVNFACREHAILSSCEFVSTNSHCTSFWKIHFCASNGDEHPMLQGAVKKRDHTGSFHCPVGGNADRNCVIIFAFSWEATQAR